jgi:hypothetical protein
MKHDVALLKLINEDDKDKKITEQLIKENYAVIRDLYYFVLESSPDFPILRPDTHYKEFFSLLQLKRDGYVVSKQQFDTLVKCDGNDKRIRRFEFIEFLVNVSNYKNKPDQTPS